MGQYGSGFDGYVLFEGSQNCTAVNKETPTKKPWVYGTSVHNGLMKISGFIGSYTHFSLAHL